MSDPSPSADYIIPTVTGAGGAVRPGAAAAAASGSAAARPGAQTSDLVCAAAYPVLGGWIRCGAPATAVWLYGCVHEHLVQRASCPDHEPVPGLVGCRACLDAGHECEMTPLREIS